MLLQCVQVTRQYKQKGKVLCTAVKDAGFDIEKDDFISIIGKSGSGKSTLLNMIAGLLCPTAGTILLEGKDIWAGDEENIAFLRNSKLGYIPQGASLLGNLTAIDNVRLPHFLYKREGDGVKRAEELLERVGLKGYEGRYPSELSGGEMKRVAIARALMNNPVLLLADEPTADIDEETTGSIMELFTEICADRTAILMATHELENIKYGKRVLKMSSGVLTEEEIEKYKKR